MKKILALLLCSALAAGCTAKPAEKPASSESVTFNADAKKVTDEEFEKFLDQYVVDVCEQDITTAQHYFEHPEKYGVDLSKCRITLGGFEPDEQEIRLTEQTMKTLKDWNPEDLNDTNQDIYQQLLWQTQEEQESYKEQYRYLDNIWSDSTGVQTVLVDFFSEYQLNTPEDVDILVKLIEDVPRFANEAIDYSRTQAKKKLFGINFDGVMDTIDQLLESKDDSPITSELDEEVDAMDLKSEEADALKKKIHTALEKSYFPSFEKIKKGLTELEKENQPISGLASKPNGKDYYKLVLKSYSGSDEDPDAIYEEINDAMDRVLKEYREIITTKPEAVEEMLDAKTQFKEISQIMPFLEERYPAEFPILKPMNYEIKPLSNEQSRAGTMAYFVVPPVDSSRPYEIRYNKRDFGDDPSSLELYNTFAHEGIPGHMYQTQYNREHFTHTIQYMFSSFGMQEGYATYAAYQTSAWTGIDKDALKIWKLSDLYSNYSVLLMDLQINYDGISLEEFEDTWGDDTASLYERLAESPGLFFGYYYGCYKLEELQTIAKESLGDLYDPVKFNNAILKAGNVEFGIVEDNVQDYINSVRKGEDEDQTESSARNDRRNRLHSSSQKSEEDSESMTPFEEED